MPLIPAIRPLASHSMVAESQISTPPMDAETGVKCSIKGSSAGHCSNGDEIGVSKTLRVVEDGNHLREHSVNRNFLGFWHRQGRVFRISRPEKIQRPGYFGRIGDGMRMGCIEIPGIAIGSATSWPMVRAFRLSRARFAAFWLCGLHRK